MGKQNLSLVTDTTRVSLGGRATHSVFSNPPQVVTIREPSLSTCLPKQAEGLFAARTNEDLMRELGELLAEIEFDTFIVATYVKDEDDPAEVPTALVMGQCPAGWVQRYDEEGYIDEDPRLAHALNGTGSFLWDRTQFDGHKAAALFEDAASYGLRAGISTPLLTHDGFLGMFSASTSLNMVVSDLASPMIRGRFLILREYLTVLLSPKRRIAVSATQELSEESIARISPRQREVLFWTASGLDIDSIADKLRISRATVRAHLADSKRRLGVTKQGHAVARALKLGVIPFPD